MACPCLSMFPVDLEWVLPVFIPMLCERTCFFIIKNPPLLRFKVRKLTWPKLHLQLQVNTKQAVFLLTSEGGGYFRVQAWLPTHPPTAKGVIILITQAPKNFSPEPKHMAHPPTQNPTPPPGEWPGPCLHFSAGGGQH